LPGCKARGRGTTQGVIKEVVERITRVKNSKGAGKGAGELSKKTEFGFAYAAPERNGQNKHFRRLDREITRRGKAARYTPPKSHWPHPKKGGKSRRGEGADNY